jgi:hypothetical protein
MEVSGQLHPPFALSPRKEPQESIVQEAGWAAWTTWSREKTLSPAGDWTPVVQPTTRCYIGYPGSIPKSWFMMKVNACPFDWPTDTHCATTYLLITLTFEPKSDNTVPIGDQCHLFACLFPSLPDGHSVLFSICVFVLRSFYLSVCLFFCLHKGKVVPVLK